jgi:hypothetical protein
VRYEVHIVRNGGANRTGQLGDINWGAIVGNTIGQGVNYGLSELKQLTTPKPDTSCKPPAGCFQCQMVGQGAIAGCIDSISTQWIAAAQRRDAGLMSDADLAAYTQGILAGLSNAQLFTPQSDSYLVSAKSVFQQRLNDINARLAASNTPNPTTSTTIPGGASVTTQTPATVQTGGTILSQPWPSLVSTSPTGGMQIFGLPVTTALAIVGLGLGVWAVVEK